MLNIISHIKHISNQIQVISNTNKNQMKYHFSPSTMAILKKTISSISKTVKKLEPVLVGISNGTATLEISLVFSLKTST